jgi:hypothetical protein
MIVLAFNKRIELLFMALGADMFIRQSDLLEILGVCVLLSMTDRTSHVLFTVLAGSPVCYLPG